MSTEAAYQIDSRRVSAESFYAAACDPMRSVAVEACAGAGKTWMLVARIVRALLDGTSAQDILAITFTKKAAGEMRGRLGAELRRCAGLEPAGLVETLKSWGMSHAEAMRRGPELKSLLDRVQAQGRQVQMRTFHSWFSSLLRGAPLSVLQELGLPLSYELLENDQEVYALVWPRFYVALAVQPDAKQAFFDSVARIGRHQTLAALKTALDKRVEFVLADAQGTVDTAVQRFGDLFPEMEGLDEPEQYAATEAAQQCLWHAARALGAASAPTFSAKGAELEQALSEQRWPGVCDALLTKGGEPRKFGTKIAGIDRVRQAQDLVERVLSARAQHDAWLHQRDMATLARVLLTCFTALKRERAWVDMNDLEFAAQRLLGDSELAGWMQQRLDARVRHLLIDEFQDTNPLQWQALSGWLGAYAGVGSGEAPSVFLVGDPKQSIYRFRRAEPQVFKAAQAFVVEGLNGALLSCDHTRRCAPQVVAALNAAMDEAQQSGEYSGFRAHTTHSKRPGSVLALPAIERPAKDGAPAEGTDELSWRDSLTQPRRPPEEETSAEREAQQVAVWIAHQLAAGASPNHFMVLARKRDRLRLVHQALRERGVAGEAPGETQLMESPAVLDVIALLDALVSPLHHLSLARALKSPLFGWGDEQLVSLVRTVRRADRTSREGSLDSEVATKPGWWEVLRSHDSTTWERLSMYQDWLSRLPPHDALSAIYDHSDALARFAAAVPPSERGATLCALRDLLSQSLAQDGGRFLTPYRFVRALKAGRVAAGNVHQADAVRLLTVHGAKGLEADTVVLLDTDNPARKPERMGVLVDWPAGESAPRRLVFLASEKSPPQCAQELLLSDQQARSVEELNALYVALTRAESRVVISSFVPHQTPEQSWWRRLLPLAQAIDASAPHASATPADSAFMLPTLPALALSLSTADSEPAPVSERDESTRVGLAMHRLLQWCPTPLGPFDWSDAHRRAVQREFDLTNAAAERALSMAQRVVSGPAAWVWSGDAISDWGNEVELWFEGQQLRLDRLVKRHDTGDWWVLDFKSAERPERDVQLLEQLERYRLAVQAARPGQAVRVAFINSNGQLMETRAHVA